jgi:Mg2+ and Co2+ transporter CorA
VKNEDNKHQYLKNMKKTQSKHFIKAKSSRKKKEFIGLSPYAVVFRGEKKIDKTLINAMDFDLNEVREFEISTAEQLKSVHAGTSLSWIFVNGLHDIPRLEEIAREFEIPNNILSDILNPSLRSKLRFTKPDLSLTPFVSAFGNTTTKYVRQVPIISHLLYWM